MIDPVCWLYKHLLQIDMRFFQVQIHLPCFLILRQDLASIRVRVTLKLSRIFLGFVKNQRSTMSIQKDEQHRIILIISNTYKQALILLRK